MNATDTITRQALSEALRRCCDQHPAADNHHRLHPDASLMADLFGLMLHYGNTSTAAAEVDPAIIAAYERWSGA
ncbi:MULTISPECIES: DUF3717 domain-containing protein [Pseudomonas]|uniref:DUF3717 domain-containing protein n=1 Tax=Pseudomonas TaxID=286 RepID=UPI001BAE692A|nr:MULTISPECIES: DUF3717 domain-containing protein [Pseudomonas]QUG93460.1 DUF3717 domain-containing protein [Pseudomonas putida]URD45749.1 DUF3717 domain-containing protein [Pseudomonas sp. BYT-5]URL00995.1 DUF3717 domain-containing protein [Pseudomonas sp. BYT-1]WRW06917.1 DUF3717 domain-containing protein [Pseudomonas putida]